ncbi:aldose 1-epimerase family protein [Microbacterium sp. ET2]|uniref:aldose 1-epimerase family protein n=1 Tax=Microbacterium albipurpureum TaxID=3050384 RepID=UPI00259D1D65|nr:aldose 1-epimerase family protein [Microbacterium sp. ET2 (Ac-2212)]WJL96552.1 aldose 1-epimerase family protein [Microbacterium sp. ET2 (Ac-2212)]
MASHSVSGTQHSLRAGDYEACIASVGATLRCLTFRGRDLVVPFGADEVRPSYRGATLAPWPNRVVDGIYTFRGVQRRVALTEPARGHALHGLGSWLDFEAIDKGPSHVTLAATIVAQTGYPWELGVETTFQLSAEGLAQTVRVRNHSDETAPWGTGPHPYLVAGPGLVDEWTLELPADDVLTVTDDRLIPVSLEHVETAGAERFDFRRARRIGQVELDHAYTGFTRDEDGFATVRVTSEDGTGVAMTWNTACAWAQIHTADKPDKAVSRLGLAVEPMTCAPDAFNAGRYDFDAGLIELAPGASSEASWRISAIV